MKLRMLIAMLLMVLASAGMSTKADAQYYRYGYGRGYYRPYRPAYAYPPYGRAYGYYYRPRPVYRPYGYYRGYYPAYRNRYHHHYRW